MQSASGLHPFLEAALKSEDCVCDALPWRKSVLLLTYLYPTTHDSTVITITLLHITLILENLDQYAFPLLSILIAFSHLHVYYRPTKLRLFRIDTGGQQSEIEKMERLAEELRKKQQAFDKCGNCDVSHTDCERFCMSVGTALLYYRSVRRT